MKLFCRGDVDGFCAIALDNMVQLLLIPPMLVGVLGFRPELVYGHVLPGVAISYLVGNVFYAWQAHRLARKENRTDVCAIPFGLNTPTMIAYIYLVMAPAKQIAIAHGAADPDLVAWRVGLVACVGSGMIEFFGAFVAGRIRAITPRAALLASLSGAGVAFLTMNFLFSTFAHPIVGLVTLGLVLLFYFGELKPRGGVPPALVVLAVGAALAWATGLAPVGRLTLGDIGWRLPVPAVADVLGGFAGGQILPYLSVILPMGLLNLLASLQCIESAAAAGDSYSPRSSLMVNGACTFAAACFGSPFPTSLYIGHPAWKRMGARAGYSTANGIFVTFVCLTGAMSPIAWAVPADCGLAIIIWIGFIITIQAFETAPQRHWPAVIMGMVPVILAWTTFSMTSAARIAGAGSASGPAFGSKLLSSFHAAGISIEGGFAIGQGTFCSALILSTITVLVIDRRLAMAAIWSLAASVLSLLGFLHSWRFVPSDAVGSMPLVDWLVGAPRTSASLFPASPYAIAYACLAAVLLLAKVFTVHDGSQPHK
jgi:AGZA family xanthine/uracil permease-like MFS transporter